MQEDVRKEFLPLESKIGWVITWFMRIFGVGALLGVFILLALFPFLVCEKKIDIDTVFSVILPCLGYSSISAFLLYEKRNKYRNRKN